MISDTFHADDEIEIVLPMGLHEYVSMDDPHKVAFMYGPVVLAAVLGCEHFPACDIVPDHLSLMTQQTIRVPKIVTDYQDLNQWIELVNQKTLTFKTAPNAKPGDVSFTLKPFYAIHHERYTIYFSKYRSEEFLNLGDETLSRDELLFDQTVDLVKTGEQQSEIEHQFKSVESYAGYLADVNMWWRDARGIDGSFSYEMEVIPNEKMALLVSYFGLNGENLEPVKRVFDLLVNDELIQTERLMATKNVEVVDVVYPISSDLLANVKPNEDGKYKVTVSFRNRFEDSIVGGILEVRTILQA